MKKVTIGMVSTLVALVWITLGAKAQSTRPTTSQVMDKIAADVESKKTPLEIYPPGLFDWLEGKEEQELLGLSSANTFSGGGGTMQSMLQTSPPEYVVVELIPGSPESDAYAINSHGQITGSYRTNSNGFVYAFLHSNGAITRLADSWPYNIGLSINSRGQVVGIVYEDFISIPGNSFIYSDGTLQYLTSDTNSSAAYGINDIGQIIGSLGWGPTEAVLYSGSSIQYLGTLGGSSYGYGINSSGHAVGYSSLTNIPFPFHAFLYANGSMEDIGTLGGTNSVAYAINNVDDVVGMAQLSNGSYHAFQYSGGEMQDLGSFGGTSEALGINVYGQVVGYSRVGSDSGPMEAFLYHNGTMYNLNNLVTNLSGWRLKIARGINDKGQIVGLGSNALGQVRAFRLDPLPAGWESIEADTSRHSLGNIGTAPSGKDSLVFITHGRIPPGDDVVVSTSWVDSMSNSVVQYLTNYNLTNWQVKGYKWIEGANVFWPPDALENAKQQGVNVGHQILTQGYASIHFIAHSAGAGLIQSATDVIKMNNPSVNVHETFLDPFVGSDFWGTSAYGSNANWADNYSTKDKETANQYIPFTYNLLHHAYNVDVTQLDITNRVQLSYWVTGDATPCYVTESVHGWPIDFYANTITGNTNTNYLGFGFPLSKEGGNWNYATNHYIPGNDPPGHILGTPDPTGCRFGFTSLSYPTSVIDFINTVVTQSTSGIVTKYPNGSVKYTTGSPAWLATFVTVSNAVNIVSFDADFQSTNGAEGLLTVYWDDSIIGSIDERVVQNGFQHYTFRFPSALNNSLHMLGFRLDPFTNIQSSVVLTNVTTTFSGVSQPFYLAMIGSTNGLPVLQLSGQSGFEYHVQMSTNLINWTPIAVLANTNSIVQFIDYGSTNYGQRFYRAVAPF